MYEKSTACNPCEIQPHNVPTLIGALKDLEDAIEALEQTIVPYTEKPLVFFVEGDYEVPGKMEMQQPKTNNVIEQIVVLRKRVQYSHDMIHNNIRRLCEVIGNY